MVTGGPLTFFITEVDDIQLTATCPVGTYAISGGGDSSDVNPGDVTLVSSEPTGGSLTSPATGWLVAYSFNAVNSGGTLTPFVVCSP